MDITGPGFEKHHALSLQPFRRITLDPGMWPERGKTGLARVALRIEVPAAFPEKYRDALAKNHRMSRTEGIDAVMIKHKLDAIVCTAITTWLMLRTSDAKMAGYASPVDFYVDRLAEGLRSALTVAATALLRPFERQRRDVIGHGVLIAILGTGHRAICMRSRKYCAFAKGRPTCGLTMSTSR